MLDSQATLSTSSTPKPYPGEERSPSPATESQPPTAKLLLTPDEFRECLGGAIGRNSIYELLRADRIKHLKIGRKLLIPYSEVENFPMREASCTV